VVFTDNEQLDSLVVAIRKNAVTGTGEEWEPVITRRIQGRRLEDSVKIPIPARAQLGRYDLVITIFDRAGNLNRTVNTFELRGDNRPPQILEAILLGLDRDAAGNYIACRQSVFDFTGRIQDNIALSEVRAVIPGVIDVRRLIQGSSVNLNGLFGRDLRLPESVQDNSRLVLTLSATDANNNTASVTFNVLINCDDQPPIIEILRTQPQINAQRETRIIEGTSFSILEGTLQDNRRLSRLNITFNRASDLLRDTVFRANFNTAGPVQLGTLLAAQRFALPPDAIPGQVFELVLFATDSAGNSAPPFRIQLNVTKDEPPLILLAEVRINGVLTELRENAEVLLPSASFVEIAGKIQDDLALEFVEILWGPRGNEGVLARLGAAQLQNLPFDFLQTGSVSRFEIPAGTPPDSSYSLIIRAKDTKNPIVERRYFFRVMR
jgi:hypothetical protein